jgi:hypothetical protein
LLTVSQVLLHGVAEISGVNIGIPLHEAKSPRQQE